MVCVPGRIGLGPGVMSGKPGLRDVFGAEVVSRVLVGSLPLSPRGCGTGARLLLTPSRPKFMMLAGVTGVMRTSSWAGKADVVVGTEGGEAGFLGGAGGGMARSTGDGESVSLTKLFRRARVERKRGVEVADLAPRGIFIDAGTIWVGRFRGTRAGSSPEGEAVRLAGLELGGCGHGSSHGLVSGEISRSDGEGKDGKAILAGAENDPG